MVERVRIGSNLGDAGYFLSRPGVDVTAPGESLLVDSRYPTLSVHQAGTITLTRYFNTSLQKALYYGTVNFPSLGYRPAYWGSIVYASANSLGIPTNASYFPGAWGSQMSHGYGGPLNNGDSDPFAEHGIWLENNTTLRTKSWVSSTSDLNIKFRYIIFKNAEET